MWRLKNCFKKVFGNCLVKPSKLTFLIIDAGYKSLMSQGPSYCKNESTFNASQ